MKIFLLLFAFIYFSSNSSICKEPNEPFCIFSTIAKFKTRHEFETCKLELEFYNKEMEEYALCRINYIICEFNCRAKSDNLCLC